MGREVVYVNWEGKSRVSGPGRRTGLLGQKEGAGERSGTLRSGQGRDPRRVPGSGTLKGV